MVDDTDVRVPSSAQVGNALAAASLLCQTLQRVLLVAEGILAAGRAAQRRPCPTVAAPIP